MAKQLEKKSGNGHGLTVSVEWDETTRAAEFAVVDNQTSDGVYVQFGEPGDQVRATVQGGVMERVSLAAIGKTMTERDGELQALNVPIHTRWPA